MGNRSSAGLYENRCTGLAQLLEELWICPEIYARPRYLQVKHRQFDTAKRTEEAPVQEDRVRTAPRRATQLRSDG